MSYFLVNKARSGMRTNLLLSFFEEGMEYIVRDLYQDLLDEFRSALPDLLGEELAELVSSQLTRKLFQ